MTAALRRRLDGQDLERGSITPLLVVLAVSLLLMVGLVVDVGARLNAVSQANDVAAQAAHAAAVQLDTGAALSAGQVQVSAVQAEQAGMSVLQGAGMTGDVVIDAQTVTVTATCSKPTTFLSLIRIWSVQGTGRAQVRIASGGA